MATDRKDENIKENETELQPDPLMKEGRASKAWMWIVGIVIVVIIGLYFYSVGR
jgi:hypothetical protein